MRRRRCGIRVPRGSGDTYRAGGEVAVMFSVWVGADGHRFAEPSLENLLRSSQLHRRAIVVEPGQVGMTPRMGPELHSFFAHVQDLVPGQWLHFLIRAGALLPKTLDDVGLLLDQTDGEKERC